MLPPRPGLPLLLLLAPLCTAAYPPQFGCNTNDTFSGRQPFYNPGLNHLSLSLCPRAALPPGAPANATCAPSQLIPCTGVTGPGTSRFTATASAEWLLNIPAQAAYLVLTYCSPQPFSWRCLASTPPATLVPVDGEVPYLVPYPSNATQFCDTAEDCSGGAPCLSAPAPPRCGAPASPAPSPPPQPVPSPSPGPPARTCNLTGTYLQFCPTCRGLGSTFRPQAYINITSTSAGGAFSFACRSDQQVGYCPLDAHQLNGTGQLAAAGNAFTLRALNGSQPFTITGVVNSTFSCATLTLLSYTTDSPSEDLGGAPVPVAWPVVWDANPPAAPPALDLAVAGATYLGSSASAQLVASGVAIVAAPAGGGAALIAVAGNGQANPGALAPVLLLGAAAGANGSVLLLRAPAPSARGSGLLPAALLKLGDRVDHIRANARGDVAVAGSFGIAVLTGLGGGGGGGGAPRVLWHDSLADVEAGTCGVCCSSGAACRVDLGDDGVVVAAFAVQSAAGWLWGAYTPSGERFLQRAQPAAALTSVLVNAATRQLGVAWIYDSNTGKEPMVMPRLAMFTYATAPPPAGVADDWTALPWDAHVYRQPGPCNGNVADGRVLDARFGRNGRLLFAGRSDGGNSPFYCGLRNVSRVTPMGVIDSYTTPYNMQSQAITNMLQLEATSGEVIVGQVQLVRVGPRGGGNTLLTLAAQTDAAGVLYELQAAAFCLPNMGNLTVNGVPTAAPADASALLVLDSAMRRRLHWTDFAAAGSGGGGGAPVDLDVRGAVVALALNAKDGMVTDGALPGTGGASATGAPVAYVVVMPTVSAGE